MAVDLIIGDQLVSFFLPVNGPAADKEKFEETFESYRPLFDEMLKTVRIKLEE